MRRGRLDALPKRQRAWSGKMPFLVGPRIEIGIVEDDPSVREGMERMINAQSNWHLRFACGSLAAARAQDCQGLSMLLLDLGLPDGKGMDLLAELDVPVLRFDCSSGGTQVHLALPLSTLTPKFGQGEHAIST